MRIGVPREVKADEYRVALTPDKVDALVRDGHVVVIERGAGVGAGFADDRFERAGAELAPSAAEVFGEADMVVKVKEPQPQEFAFFRPGLLLFTYLHLAAAPEVAQALLKSGVAGVAYETVQLSDGSLPLLAPMSEVAGRLSPQIAAFHLQSVHGGPGKLLGGVPGTKQCKVVVIGAGTVGYNATRVAHALGAHVSLFDINVARLRQLDDVLDDRIETLYSNQANLIEELALTDVLIGAVLVPGATAPRIVTREMVRAMPPGSLIIDVAIDQGGCVETIRPTSHTHPTYAVDGVLHYAVPNMPSLVSNTASHALSNATFPYVRRLAGMGLAKAMAADPALGLGLNTYDGHVTHQTVAKALGREYTPLAQAVGG
jgi:alanine dehydrogenase